MLDAKNYLGKMLAERYRIVRVIGHGASSAVFYAEDMMTRRDDGTPQPVAIKVLDRDFGEYKLNSKSFHTEIHAVAGIPTNPHIVAMKDVSFRDDEHFIVMEYVSGKTLKQYAEEKGGKLSAKEIVSVALQILQALRVAHEAGVVHRDIKPQNIMVERADAVGKRVDIPCGADMPFIKLADFGIALLPDEDLFAMKDKGVGTVHYISPEQASGGVVDARSDIYSLGVVMYELATGNVPFDAQSATGIISKHQIEIPFHVRNNNAGIPPALDQIIFTAMEKNPSARFKDASAMEKKLREVMQQLLNPDEALRGESNAFFAPKTHVSGEAKSPKAPKQRKVTAFGKNEKARKRILFGGVAAGALAILLILGVLLIPLLTGPKTMDVTVPKLIGTEYKEDSTYADGISVPKEKIVYKYDDDIAKGIVISQDPAPNVLLQDVTGVELILTVSLGPEMAEFRLPQEYRIDFETAKRYLQDEARPYQYLRVEGSVQETQYNPNYAGGEVIGAYRVSDNTELSLDGDEVYKSKAERVMLRVNPPKPILINMTIEDRENAKTAEAYLASIGAGMTVTGVEVDASLIGKTPAEVTQFYPSGFVTGIRLSNGITVPVENYVYNQYGAGEDVKLIVTPTAFYILQSTHKASAAAAKEYIAEKYPSITVKDTVRTQPSSEPAGTVIGAVLEDGTPISLEGQYLPEGNVSIILIVAN